MSREVYTVSLFPRQHVPRGPSPGQDVVDVVLGATLLFVLYALVWLVLR